MNDRTRTTAEPAAGPSATAQPRAQRPFVGRNAELLVLATAGQAARAGSSRCVLLEAEPGLGKTSLLRAFLDDDGVGGAALVQAAGEQAEVGVPLAVVDVLVRGLPASARQGLVALSELLAGGRPDPLSVGRDLLQLVGNLQGSGELVVLVVDDLQWVDQQSSQALLFLVRRLRFDRVLVLVATRSDAGPVTQAWSRLSDNGGADRLVLAPFGVPEVTELAVRLGRPRIPPAVAARLVDHTRGNPLYLAALLGELSNRALAGRVALPAPSSVSEVTAGRVRDASEAGRALIEAAAVLGQEVSLSLVAELAGLADPLAVLDEAVGLGLLLPLGGPTDRIAWTHPVLRAAVYDALSDRRRRALHARTGGLLAGAAALSHRAAAAAPKDEEVAHALVQDAARLEDARQLTSAAMRLLRAHELSSDDALRTQAACGALVLLLRDGRADLAVEVRPLVEALAPSPRRSAALGFHTFATGSPGDCVPLLESAYREHDAEREPEVGVAAADSLSGYCSMAGRSREAIEWSDVVLGSGIDLWRHSACHVVQVTQRFIEGDEDGALQAVEQLPNDPSSSGLESLDAYYGRGWARLWTGRTHDAIGDLSAVLRGLHAGQPVDYPELAASHLAQALYRLGRWDEAQIPADLGVQMCEEHQRAWSAAFVHALATYVPAARGEHEHAQAHLDQAWSTARASGLPFHLAYACAASAHACWHAGDAAGVLEVTEPLLQSGKGWSRPAPEFLLWPLYRAEALIDAGRLHDAAEAVRDLETQLTPLTVRPAVVVRRLQLRLAAAGGDERELRAALGRPVPVYPDAPFESALLHLDRARALKVLGERAAALAELDRALPPLQRLRAHPSVLGCQQEMAALGAQLPVADPAVPPLTGHELSVALLASRGLSNREIGAQLYLSRHTADYYLRRLYARYGVHSRGDLAAALAAHGHVAW